MEQFIDNETTEKRLEERLARGELLPAVVQDAHSGRVLMVAWMNREALRQTCATGESVFWSRSRQALWPKGATSGNVQKVTGIWLDCDGDTLLLRVKTAGPACHTGEESCFFTSLDMVRWGHDGKEGG